jgi:hypothetical protein
MRSQAALASCSKTVSTNVCIKETRGSSDTGEDEDEDAIMPTPTVASSSYGVRRRNLDTRPMSKSTSMDRAMSSIFVLGSTQSRHSSDNKSRASEPVDLASLSREELGGIEYRALRVLLKITAGDLNPKTQ